MGGEEQLQTEAVIYLCRENHSVVCDSELRLGGSGKDSGIEPEQKCQLYQIALSGHSVAKERWEQSE